MSLGSLGFEDQQCDFSFATPHLRVRSDQCDRLQAGGGRYIADFITTQEELALLDAIDKESWLDELQRRVQHYGYRYNYKKRKLDAEDRIGDLPDWIAPICDRLAHTEGMFAACPDQLIVNEYKPGQGITPHTDSGCFGAVVASLSLGSDCLMDIETPAEKFPIVLQRKSLLVLQGDSRNVWKHAIALRKTDIQADEKILRQRRVSLTFRTVL